MNNKINAGDGLKRVKNFVKWEIEFKSDSKDTERIEGIIKLEKYLIDSIYRLRSFGFIHVLNLLITPGAKKDTMRLALSLVYDNKATDKTGAPTVPPTPPKYIRSGFGNSSAATDGTKAPIVPPPPPNHVSRFFPAFQKIIPLNTRTTGEF